LFNRTFCPQHKKAFTVVCAVISVQLSSMSEQSALPVRYKLPTYTM